MRDNILKVGGEVGGTGLLFSCLVVLGQMLLYLFSDCMGGNRLWEGWEESLVMLEAL